MVKVGLTYFQVVATEEIFLRFNGCENVFKVTGNIVTLPFRGGGYSHSCCIIIIYILYILLLKKSTEWGGCV